MSYSLLNQTKKTYFKVFLNKLFRQTDIFGLFFQDIPVKLAPERLNQSGF